MALTPFLFLCCTHLTCKREADWKGRWRTINPAVRWGERAALGLGKGFGPSLRHTYTHCRLMCFPLVCFSTSPFQALPALEMPGKSGPLSFTAHMALPLQQRAPRSHDCFQPATTHPSTPRHQNSTWPSSTGARGRVPGDRAQGGSWGHHSWLLHPLHSFPHPSCSEDSTSSPRLAPASAAKGSSPLTTEPPPWPGDGNPFSLMPGMLKLTKTVHPWEEIAHRLC